MVTNSHRDFVISSKILGEIADIHDFIDELTLEQYLDDVRTQKAVSMTLINIGELCGAYSVEFLEQYKEIPWKQIKGLRNIAAHKYESISQSDVWETITTDVPVLEALLKKDIQL